MNIFVTDTDPCVAAQNLCDRHVRKMVLETAQILCTVLKDHGLPYKPTHENHPCVLWAGASRWNFDWLLDHGTALGREFEFRFGKPHKSSEVIESCRYIEFDLGREHPTPFVVCVSDDCPDIYRGNACLMYRWAIRDKGQQWATKGRPMKWTLRTPPAWF